jgi:hypothetical protein
MSSHRWGGNKSLKKRLHKPPKQTELQPEPTFDEMVPANGATPEQVRAKMYDKAVEGAWSPDSPGTLADAALPSEDEGGAPQAHAPDEALPAPETLLDAPEVEARPTLPEAAPAERPFVQLRIKEGAAPAEMEKVKGKIITDDHYNVLLTGPTIVRKPSGALLCIYLPGVLTEVMDSVYPVLTKVRMITDNRGLAAGAARVKAGQTRTRTKQVMSGVMGSMDPVGSMQFCRLTAYTAKNLEQWDALKPLWQAMSEQFAEHVPDRFKTQAEFASRTQPDWIIEGTPYTTITINNSYATGVHTDSGDLDEGFSNLAVCRRGNYSGGRLVFPQFHVAADLQHGDMILMDAHEWHGNTAIQCECGAPLDNGPCKVCHAERISVVAYFRTKMTTCGTYMEETEKKAAYGARRIDGPKTVEDENAEDLQAVTTTA